MQNEPRRTPGFCNWRFACCIRHFAFQPITSNPMERAVPATVLTADSSVSQLRSGIFVLAMYSTCFAVTVQTFVLLGSAEHLVMCAARFRGYVASAVYM